MSKVMLLMFLSILTQMFAITVDGYAYLEGETDHSGIEVFFQRVAPDESFSYTVYTDASGYYTLTVEQGIYDLMYKKLKYEKSASEGISLYSDYTIPDKTLIFTNELYGYVSGTLERGIYPISGTITVDLGDTLIVAPGVALEFYNDAEFIVNGLLIAQGAENDSIKFTSQAGGTWPGIRFSADASDESFFDHIILENSSDKGIDLYFCSLKVSNSSFRANNSCALYLFSDNDEINFLDVSNCEFINNECSENSLIYTKFEADLKVTDCVFRNNDSDSGLIQAYQAHHSFIKNCDFNNNSSWINGVINNYGYPAYGGYIEIEGCQITDNYTTNYFGAINNNGTLIMRNTTVTGNECYSGGAISTDGSLSYLSISNCIISGNRSRASESNGGGIKLYCSTALVENTVITGNTAGKGAGIWSDCGAVIVNCVITKNNGNGIYALKPFDLQNCILSANTNYAVYNYYSANLPVIEYNNFYSNGPADFYQCNQYLGIDVLTNSNGDPCDAWYNMSMDPLFLDDWNGDFMLTENSPCIDAGTNTIADYEFPLADLAGNYRIWDGNSDNNAIVDMGAYEYGAISVGIENTAAVISDFQLYQNYPNPFNPVTSISYALPKAAQVELNVYNLNGQLVQSLVNGRLDKGIHKAEFNGADLTSGMYIYNLKVDGKAVQSKKMMLLK